MSVRGEVEIGDYTPHSDGSVVGAPAMVFAFVITDSASADWDIALARPVRVIDAWFVKTGGNGAGSNTYTVENNGTAITDAMDGNVSDKAVGRAGTIDDAQHEVSSTLRVAHVKSGGNSAAIVYVSCLPL